MYSKNLYIHKFVVAAILWILLSQLFKFFSKYCEIVLNYFSAILYPSTVNDIPK